MPAVYGSLGYVLLDIGWEEEALQYNLKRLEEYDETDPVMLDTVGQIYYRRGELDKAKEYFSEAVKIKNNLVDSLYYLGILEQRDGNIRRARAMLSRASRQHISTLTTDIQQHIPQTTVNSSTGIVLFQLMEQLQRFVDLPQFPKRHRQV